MYTLNNASEENKLLLDSLSKKLSYGPKISNYLYSTIPGFPSDIKISLNDDESFINKSSNGSELSKKFTEDRNKSFMTKQHLLDIQSEFLLTFIINRSMLNQLNTFDSKQILIDETLAVSDEKFEKFCHKVTSMNEDCALVFSKLVLLPKLNNANGKISETSGELLKNLFLNHEELILKEVLCPLFSNTGRSSNYIELLTYLLDKNTNANNHALVSLLGALSAKQDLEESDLPTFMCIIERMDATNSNCQKSVLDFLCKHSCHFAKSIKFGLCLLSVIKKMGEEFVLKDSLLSLIGTHKSSMRKTIERNFQKYL